MATPYPPGTPWQQPADPNYRGHLADAVGAGLVLLFILLVMAVCDA